jgi:hypothetical protein
MQLFCCYAATLAVATIFYTYRAWRQVRTRKDRVLRERVAYMLWVVAGLQGRSSESIPALRS